MSIKLPMICSKKATKACKQVIYGKSLVPDFNTLAYRKSKKKNEIKSPY